MAFKRSAVRSRLSPPKRLPETAMFPVLFFEKIQKFIQGRRIHGIIDSSFHTGTRRSETVKDHKKMGLELVKIARILMGIGIVLSAVLIIMAVRDTNGSLLCAAIMAVVGVIILCKLMEAAGHGIVLLQEQNEDSKRMIDLLEKQGAAAAATPSVPASAEETVSTDAEPEDRQEEDPAAIDAFIEELQNTFRHQSTEGTNYTIVKDCTDENRIVITKEVESLASKINHFGENYMDSWQNAKSGKTARQSGADGAAVRD